MKIALELIYEIDGENRPAVRYEDGQITTPGASEATDFSIVGYQQAHKDIQSFITVVYQAAVPTISPVARSYPSLYSVERSHDGNVEKIEFNVAGSKYEAITDGGGTITVETYDALDISWDTFLWMVDQIGEFLQHITSRG